MNGWKSIEHEREDSMREEMSNNIVIRQILLFSRTVVSVLPFV